MEMGGSTSLGRCTQSIEICILLVNNDVICHNIIMNMLQNCNHEAFDCEKAMDALNVIRERREKLELVITNVERTDANKLGIIEHIEKEFKLRVALMRPDGNTNIPSGGTDSGITVYMVQCSSLADIKKLWENALARERGKMLAKEVNNDQRESFLEISSDSGVSERTRVRKKCKRNENEDTSDEDEDIKHDSKTEKKARIQWNDEMHRKFLEAIAQLGHEKAFPKKIVEVMNIPGLTREHVASHLQKHRMNLKKTQESNVNSFYGRTSITDLRDPYFPTRQSASLTFGFQRSLPVPASYSSCFNPELSTSKSRFGPGQYHKQNFRVYGDHTKNVLLSVENTNANSGFVGLRLADDGKSVEIGQKGSLDKFGITTDLRSSVSGLNEINSSLQCPSTFDVDPNGNFEPYHLSALPPLELDGNENVGQFLSPPVSFCPHQESLPPLEAYNVNENFDLYPFSSLPPLLSDVEENLENSLPTLGGYNGNENVDLYPFSSLPPLISDVEANLDHCPLLPVDFSPLQECSLNRIENSDDYFLQQYSSTQFETFGEEKYDIDHLTFGDCTTTTMNPSFESGPSTSVPGKDGSMPPLQLDELDCFAVNEDIDVLLGNNSTGFSVEDFPDFLFDKED